MAITDEVLDRIPVDPGVYLFKDAAGGVIYVGKAISLRARVRQYFRGGDERLFVAAGFLARAADDVETIVVPSEKEALLLENHLIKQHQPRFNVKLRDDKQYLVLRLLVPEAPSEGATKPERRVFPRVEVVRNIRDDGARYFGPVPLGDLGARDAAALESPLPAAHVHRSRAREPRPRVSAVPDQAVHRRRARCRSPAQAYREQVEDVMMFLGGKNDELVERLRTRMDARSSAEDFEAAATCAIRSRAVERTLARQHVVQDDFVDQDVWGLFREGDVVEVAVLFVRAGKLVGRRTFHAREQDRPDSDVLADFVQQYYATGTFIPDEVMLSSADRGRRRARRVAGRACAAGA